MDAVALRPARRADAEAIHEVHTRSVRWYWRCAYTPHEIDVWLSGRTPEAYWDVIDSRQLFVAVQRGRVVGFGDGRPGRVEAVFVDPSVAGLGVGSALLRRAVEMAREEHAGTVRLESTLNAVPFYEAHGFVRTGRSTAVKRGVTLRLVAMELAE
jgi:GNAT superfamily N-acetyltransferase